MGTPNTTDEYKAAMFESYKTAIELLRKLEAKVEDINEKSIEQKDWGYVGDLNCIIGYLKTAIN